MIEATPDAPAMAPGAAGRLRALAGLGLGLGLGALLGALVAADPGAPPLLAIAAAVGLAGLVGAVAFGVSGWAEVRFRARPRVAGLVAWLGWVVPVGAAAGQLLYLRAALRGGPDAGFAAIERTLGELAPADVPGLAFLVGLVCAAAVPPAAMVRARAAGERVQDVTDLAVAAVPAVGYAIFGALVLGVVAGADFVERRATWSATCGAAAMGIVLPLLLLGWCLLPAWAAALRLVDRLEGWLRAAGRAAR